MMVLSQNRGTLIQTPKYYSRQRVLLLGYSNFGKRLYVLARGCIIVKAGGGAECVVTLLTFDFTHDSLNPTLPQTNMETHIAPFLVTVVFKGPLLGFHVSFQECNRPDNLMAHMITLTDLKGT